MLYSWHKQLTPPTCISLSLKCHFTDPNKLDLIVVKGNVLGCYRLYTVASGEQPTARMELLHEFVLQGIVTSIGSCRTQDSIGLDSLLLTFSDAKVFKIYFWWIDEFGRVFSIYSKLDYCEYAQLREGRVEGISWMRPNRILFRKIFHTKENQSSE